MTARIINGTAIARSIQDEVRAEVARIKTEAGKVPGLAVVLAGNDPASEVYVRAKEKACAEAGIASFARRLPAAVSEKEVLSLIAELNADRSVHGILIQIPLPRAIDEGKVMEAVDPDKDVDGFHPRNLGRLLLGRETFLPCTPAGIREMLIRERIETAGRHVVIVGRSNIVGKPLMAILIQKAAGDALKSARQPKPSSSPSVPAPASLSSPQVVLETTQGEIVITLFPAQAPKTVENFLGLVNKGYYNGTVFHRVIRNFMIQGGDPTATGRGGESIWSQPFEDEFSPSLAFDRVGLLAMANAGPNSNGSQFFITVGKTPWLNQRHTIFGEVVTGFSAVEAISRVAVGPADRPLEEQKIIKAYEKK